MDKNGMNTRCEGDIHKFGEADGDVLKLFKIWTIEKDEVQNV